MILFEKEQPFKDKIVPIPCFIITKEEHEITIKDDAMRLAPRKEALAYMKTRPFVETILIFEEDEVLHSIIRRRELERQEHEKLCDSLTNIYQVPIPTADFDSYHYYQINLKKDEPIPENGFTVYRDGFEIASNIMSRAHAMELAFDDALDNLRKQKETLEEQLKETSNLLKILEEHGLYSDGNSPLSFIDQTDLSQ